MAEENTEITLDDVSTFDSENLSDEQSTFIKEHAEELDDDQKETFKGVLEPEEKEDEEINPDDVEIPTRNIKGKKDSDDEDDDEDLDPEDAKKIDRVVAKRLREEGFTGTKDQIEVDAFIRSKPEFGKYRAVTLKYMSHPDYKNIPVDNIMAIVSAKDMQALGAQKEREAAKKAKDTQSGKGTTVRTPSKGVDWSNMPKEDFEAQRAKVLGRQGS